MPLPVLRSAPALVLAILLSGCASIVHGPTQTVRVSSEPAGATVYLNGEEQGATPLELDLDRDARYVLRLEHPSHTPQSRTLRRGADVWAIAGLVLWGPFGPVSIGVDWVTGALYEQRPSSVFIRLGEPDRRP